ncbi:GNAT family N-acetyltransferase [Ideonella sp. BN130291]|uniref:GNAT family N-acetyltransferase n=1 Tax=Ideonella sp. BN130291 TaxID=3112940 RepID=UPI002E25A80C|nr:GNAT family N-acetyltransferase [Ideonella sp. BN130291]
MTPFEPTVIHTDRLTLRWLGAADAPALFTIFSDPEVMRYWSTPPVADMAQVERTLAAVQIAYADGSSMRLGIVRSEDEALVGTCTVFDVQAGNRRAEIGYALGRAHWGRGYMHEALEAFVDHLFGPLGLNRLEADIDPRNTASARTLQRLGFQQEGFLRERWIVNGQVSDSALYGLLQRDWTQRPIAVRPTRA